MHPAFLLNLDAAIFTVFFVETRSAVKRLYETYAHPKKRQVSLTHKYNRGNCP